MKSSDDLSHAGTSPETFVSEIFDFEIPLDSELAGVGDSSIVFDEDAMDSSGLPVPGYDTFRYVPFGPTDRVPFDLIKTAGSDEILSQNLFFNILACYGTGVEYMDLNTGKPTRDPEIRDFIVHNSLKELYLEQCTDMKYYFFAVAVIILDRDRSRIVKVVHKDAAYCRFEKADKKGRINHIFYADWRQPHALKRGNVEVLTLLDPRDPLGHLEVLTGRAPGADGTTRRRSNEYKFAVVMKFPTPGQRYYPAPYYTSLFRGDWFDLKRLIGKAKKSKIKNHSSVKYQVEIHKDYWPSLLAEEKILDPLEQKKRIEKEKQNIKNFVMGIKNAGKVWITGYYIDSYGKEQRMVRINVVDSGKEGGDWSEDIQETSNVVCYALNIHPNLVGATPGKSQSNNSGSDKRELFTLKQSLETAFHDCLTKLHNLIIFFNRWESSVEPKMPIIMLTTLDKKTDAVKTDSNGTSDPNS